MTYQPVAPPNSGDPALTRFLLDELNRIAAELAELQARVATLEEA